MATTITYRVFVTDKEGDPPRLLHELKFTPPSPTARVHVEEAITPPDPRPDPTA